MEYKWIDSDWLKIKGLWILWQSLKSGSVSLCQFSASAPLQHSLLAKPKATQGQLHGQLKGCPKLRPATACSLPQLERSWISWWIIFTPSVTAHRSGWFSHWQWLTMIFFSFGQVSASWNWRNCSIQGVPWAKPSTSFTRRVSANLPRTNSSTSENLRAFYEHLQSWNCIKFSQIALQSPTTITITPSATPSAWW